MPEDPKELLSHDENGDEEAAILYYLEQEEAQLEHPDDPVREEEEEAANLQETLEVIEQQEEEEEDGEEAVPENFLYLKRFLSESDLQDDLVQEYLREISFYRQLTEKSVATLFSNAQQDDQKVTMRLIDGNLRLVVFIARRYVNRGMALIDLIQEGNQGLMKAASLYKPDQGTPFGAFATIWIKWSIRDALRNVSIAHGDVYIRERLIVLRDVLFTLALDLGETEPSEEVALECYNALEIRKWRQRYKKEPHRIDLAEYRQMVAWISMLPEDVLLDLESSDEVPEEAAVLANRKAMLSLYVRQCGLKPFQELIVKAHFGLLPGFLPCTLRALATMFDRPVSTIGATLLAGLKRLRDPEHEEKRQQMLSDFWERGGESYD